MIKLRRLLKGESGFTVSELLAALLVLSLGIIFVVGVFDSSMRSAGRAQVRAAANNLANELVDKIRLISYDNITQSYLEANLGTTRVEAGFNFNIAYAVTDIDDVRDNDPQTAEGADADRRDYKCVVVTVSWTTPPPASPVVVETMINNNPVEPPSTSNDTESPYWVVGNPLSGTTQQSPLGIKLTWDPAAATDNQGVVGYLVERKESIVSGWTLIATVAPSVGELVDTYTTGEVSYDYIIRAFDSAGNVSEASNVVTLVAPTDTTPPQWPLEGANLVATAITSAQINLTWTAATDNAGVAGYKIYRTLVLPFGSTPYTTTSGAFYADTGLTPGTTYYYYVTAFDWAGNESGPSTVVSATTFH